jgi:hypothetical protein
MSEQISHIAFFEDMARLVGVHPALSPLFNQALVTYPDHGVVASSARGNHLYAVPLLEKAREQLPIKAKEQENLKMVAGGLGWAFHRAIDMVMKPLSIKRTAQKPLNPRFAADEGEIYQDSVTFREVFNRGKATVSFQTIPVNSFILSDGFKDHPAHPFFHTESLEELMALSVSAAMFGVHHQVLQPDSPDRCLALFQSGFQEFSENLATYINAYQYPDPEKVDFYLQRINFYQPEDPMIRLVRQGGKGKLTPKVLAMAREQISQQSAYAQALEKALTYTEQADLYFKKAISKDALYDAMENFHPPYRL